MLKAGAAVRRRGAARVTIAIPAVWERQRSSDTHDVPRHAGAHAATPKHTRLGRVLQQDAGEASVSGASGPDLPQCMTPWEVFNSTAELSFWAEALQTVGFAGAALALLTCNKPYPKTLNQKVSHTGRVCITAEPSSWASPVQQ